jgi:hypothetical protein
MKRLRHIVGPAMLQKVGLLANVSGALTSLDRRSENVRVLPVVIAELELSNIERHVFAAHFVECADHAALEDRPETFNGLSMDCPDDILAPGMVHSGMRIFAVKTLITSPLISAKQADSDQHWQNPRDRGPNHCARRAYPRSGFARGAVLDYFRYRRTVARLRNPRSNRGGVEGVRNGISKSEYRFR